MSVDFRWRGKQASQQIIAAAMKGLQEGAEHIMETANRDVPHDEGTLERSGTPGVGPTAIIPAVGALAVYGSYDTPYAVRLHEHPEYNFQHGRVGKWLENAANREGKRVKSYVAKRIKEVT